MPLSPGESDKLNAKSGVGKGVYFKIKGSGHKELMGIIEDEVSLIVDEYKHVIQKVKGVKPFWDGSTYAYRTGYWTFTAVRRKLGWGQYHQFLTETEYQNLLAQARAKGWPI